MADDTEESTQRQFTREDVKALAKRMKAERLRLRLAWPAYAVLMQRPHGTTYKVATGGHKRPHDLTIIHFHERLAAIEGLTRETVRAEIDRLTQLAAGAAEVDPDDEVVSGRQ